MVQPTSAARPKRAGEDFAKQYENTTKKPRFDYRNPSTLAADAPEEDLILDADVIGKSGNQTKRNAVNIDGYESDSEEDNFDERARERKRQDGSADAGSKGGKSKDEDEDDMFADLEEEVQGTKDGDEDEDLGREGKGRGKNVRFLERGEVEGEVFGSKSGGHVKGDLLVGRKGKEKEKGIEDEDSSSGEDEDRDLPPDAEEMEDDDLAAEVGAGGKKRHAPRLDAFNLKDEEEEGRFDESGNYVRKAADPDAVNDSWLEGLSKKDMKRAREAQEKRDGRERQLAAESDALLTGELLGQLIGGLEVGETVLEALQRLNKGQGGKRAKEKKIPAWKRKKMIEKGEMDVDSQAAAANGNGNGNGIAAEDPAETKRKAALESITNAADALFGRSMPEIYDTEREMLMRMYKRETGDEWQPPASSSTAFASNKDGEDEDDADEEMWEYRWSDARDGGEHHGPYDGKTMRAWNDAGYFGEGVEFRRVGKGEEGWGRVLDVR